MAQIPRKLLDELTKEINALSEAGQQMILNALENAEWETIEDLRVLLVNAMEMACGSVADMSAARAAEFYDEVRTAAVGNALGATVEAGRDPKKTEGAIRAFVQTVVDTGSTALLANRLAERVDIEVKAAAENCIAANCSLDPLKPKYARVMTGFDTCAFCFMLSSFGFHYNSEETVSHAHANCDCRAVPGFDGMKIAGYDPDAMYERLNQCKETIGGDDAIRKEWESLPKEKREEYEAKHGKDAYSKFSRNRIVRECETRDSGWLRTGKASRSWAKEKGARPDKKERASARLLEKHGLIIDFKKPIDTTGKRTADATIADVKWEMKNPEGSSSKAVKNQLKSAVGTRGKEQQCERVVISNVASDLSFSELCKQAEDLIDENRFVEIVEILIVDKEGEVRRYRRN